ncbi:spoIIIJ-associated protein [Sporobacter termitidis DSM 10068]|uniref:RNA-binding protein KhpB n=1 Tax=Sporobacter termitidis DSM 10068 TaxID=1123282 RepID=A0A1M5YML9_9FIRM|nr:RNA-binding cell elongation regulator Jag/EloR [Sporobacter termitidis]SHI13158.1 spoIIIJ-associated protein [Sporobacter termitidis DSM 10068]
MLKSIEVSGKSEEDAIQTALGQLGLMRDEVSVEIIQQAKAGFLGLKSTPAVIRVSYECDETHAERVEKFLTGLFLRMGVKATPEIKEADGVISVNLTGEDPGALIGRRGETLDAIQHLTNYVVNRGLSGRVRVNVDTENYRERRNEALEHLAEKVASKVIKYRRNMTLEPMNSYERHIIHTALQDYENVTTYSIGTEPNRRIVVAYEHKAGPNASSPAPNYKEWH